MPCPPRSRAGPTALITHGANPGLVSHFVKQALLNLAADTGLVAPVPATRAEWAALAQTLSVKVIHIAERDTQVANVPKQRGRVRQHLVGRWFSSAKAASRRNSAGARMRRCGPRMRAGTSSVRAPRSICSGPALRPASAPGRRWKGPFHGFLITHNESISIADYYTVKEDGAVAYRPTVHYAYHPADDAVLSIHELAGKNWEVQSRTRLMMDEITSGMDELGVLLMGHDRGAYWYGSRLTIEEARSLAPYNNATSLQVTAAVLAGVIWVMENPARGIIEPDAIDHERILEITKPYLGEVVGVYSDWTPLQDRGRLFPGGGGRGLRPGSSAISG